MLHERYNTLHYARNLPAGHHSSVLHTIRFEAGPVLSLAGRLDKRANHELEAACRV